MAIDDFDDCMNDTVTHEEASSRNNYGSINYGSAVSYESRVVYKTTLVRGPDGAEILAKGIVWFKASPTIDTEDRVTLPDGSTPPILMVERYPDEEDLHHTKLFFG